MLIEFTQWRGFVGGKPFTFKDVPEVRAAGKADDLGSDPVGIGNSSDPVRQPLVKSRPSTASVKLRDRAVERLIALFAVVGSAFRVIGIDSPIGIFGSFPQDDRLFIAIERIEEGTIDLGKYIWSVHAANVLRDE